MIYNAEGDLLTPFVAYKEEDNIPQAVRNHFNNRIEFCRTKDGSFDESSLIDVCNYIEKYVCKIQDTYDTFEIL